MMSELLRLHTHFPPFEKGRATPGLILCLCSAFPASLLWGDPACYRRSPRAESLLIHRIQSHTHPKRRKFCLKHAGQKSVKDKLPEQRKGPKRAVECWLKVQTHVWDRIPRHSNPTHRTKHCQTGLKSIKTQQKVLIFLFLFPPFLVIPNARISQIRLIWYSAYFVWIHYRE